MDPQPAPPADVRQPPVSFWRIMASIGPGLIISANIVGTGELIGTTRLGADVGFILLWFILFSCFIKLFVQVELGRYSVSEGLSTVQAMDRFPGPRLLASWLIWIYLAMYLGTILMASGMVGSCAHLLAAACGGGAGSQAFWAIVTAASCASLLVVGRYRLIEGACTLMVGLFTLCTAGAVLALAWTPFAIGPAEITEGLSFRLPESFLVAFAVFGMTGVGAGELVFYPYWCLEKGYARFVGPRDESPAWLERARGWLRVMTVDAWFSFVVYTTVTVAFYLLGASILHAKGLGVDNADFVTSLSRMYQEAFGPAGRWVFFIGAIAVVYSTFFVSTASNARIFADLLASFRILRSPSPDRRTRVIRIVVVAIPVLVTIIYLIGKEPVTMVLIGGAAQAIMLPFLALLALVCRHRWIAPRLRPGRVWTVFLWLAFLTMTALGIYNFVEQARKLAGPGAPQQKITAENAETQQELKRQAAKDVKPRQG